MVLLDHEVIHWGDPAFDLGFSLTHLLSKAHYLADLRRDVCRCGPPILARIRQAWDPWIGATALEPRAVRHTLGCLLARVAGRSPLEYLDEPHRTTAM